MRWRRSGVLMIRSGSATDVLAPLGVAVAAVLMVGCAAADAMPSAPGSTATTAASASAAAAGLRTCGKVTGSTGVQRKLLAVHLSGPTVLVTGQTFYGTVTVSLRPHSGRRSVTLMSGAPVLPVIARGTSIVGQYVGLVGGVGVGGVIGPHHPFRFRGPSSVLLRGCPAKVDPAHPDRTRKLLPPGRYTLYAYIEDDVNGDNGSLRSQPLQITVKARPTG